MTLTRPVRRLSQIVAGCALIGVGAAMLLQARLGMDPYSILLEGVARRTGRSFGTVNVAVGLLLLALCWWPGRIRPGIAAFVQPLVIGATVDLALAVIVAPTGLPDRLLLAAAGGLTVGCGAGLYLAAGLGSGAFDSVPLVLRRLVPALPFGLAYGLVLATFLLAGVLAGGTAGPFTPLLVLGLGPVVAFARHRTLVDRHRPPAPPPTPPDALRVHP